MGIKTGKAAFVRPLPLLFLGELQKLLPMTTEYILFDFSDMRLTDRSNIIMLMTEIAAGDRFRFLKKAIVCDDVPGDLHVPNTPEYLDRAWSNAVRAAPRYGGAYWMEFENKDGLRLNFGFDPKQLKRLNLTVSRAASTSRVTKPTCASLCGLPRWFTPHCIRRMATASSITICMFPPCRGQA